MDSPVASRGRVRGRVYRPRRPRESPLYRVVERHFEDFERVYSERYQKRYGHWRPVVADAAAKFLTCGVLRYGFARVRCGTCHHELLLAFSCRRRCLCPSCHQKRALVMAAHVAEDVCAPVPHRQLVFTIPKRFRLFFRFDRTLLGELARLAWQTVLEVYRTVLDRGDVVPGAVSAIQSFGRVLQWHPHLHALVTDGAFAPDGTFIPLPVVDDEPFALLFREKIFDLLLRKGRITDDVVRQMRSWRHSGFSVDRSVRIGAGDTAGLERLARYLVRCPLSLARMIRVTGDGTVLYRADKTDCHRFPKAASADLFGGTSRNFQLLGPLDFLAELTQHIPERGKHLVRYAGWYSNKARGLRAKKTQEHERTGDREQAGARTIAIEESLTPSQAESRRRWAQLIQRVFEVDPLICPRCQAPMRIVAFIERRQEDVIERILRHLGLEERPTSRAPPAADETRDEASVRELRYVPVLDHLAEHLDVDGADKLSESLSEFDLDP